MPRQHRLLVPGEFYQLICRGNNKMKLFIDREDFIFYLSLVNNYFKTTDIKISYYVLMSNHVHLTVRAGSSESLSLVMQKINQSYSRYWHRRYEFVGHIWQGRFKSLLLSDDAYLLTSGIYIELNPVRAGMVAIPEDYQWSSYAAHAFGKKDNIVDIFYDPAYLALGTDQHSREIAFRALVKMWMNYKKVPGTKQAFGARHQGRKG